MKSKSIKIPDHLKPKNDGTDELFKNSLLEKFTRTHIATPVIIHLSVCVYVSYLALRQIDLILFSGLFLSGWVVWTFTEYSIHRFVYHSKTNMKWLLSIQHAAHGIHHQYPKDPTRLAMPPLPAFLIASFFYGVFWLTMGNYAVAFFPGFLFGYVLYISLHYAEHRYKAPRFRPLHRLWKYHMQHHYRYPETKLFGVSTMIWDRLLGTMPKEQ